MVDEFDCEEKPPQAYVTRIVGVCILSTEVHACDCAWSNQERLAVKQITIEISSSSSRLVTFFLFLGDFRFNVNQ